LRFFLGEKSTHMQRCRIEFIANSAPFSHQMKIFWELQTVHGAASRVYEGAASGAGAIASRDTTTTNRFYHYQTGPLQ
jgi:hypothetical protein